MPQTFRRVKRPLFVVFGIVLGAFGTAAVGLAFSSRTTGTTRQIVHFSDSMSSAGSKTLYEDGQFKIKGNCIALGGGVFRAQPVIKTKSDHAAFVSANGDANDQDWNVADGAKKIQSDANAAQGSSVSPDFADHSDDSFFGAIRKNGAEVLHGFTWSAAFHGSTCRWGGYLVKVTES